MPCKGHLAMCGDILNCHYWKGGSCYCYSVSGSWCCWKTSYDICDSPITKKCLALNVNSANIERLWPSVWIKLYGSPLNMNNFVIRVNNYRKSFSTLIRSILLIFTPYQFRTTFKFLCLYFSKKYP